VSDKKRNLVDDVVEGARRLWDEVDQILNPEKRKKRAKVPVPVRIRDDNPRQPRNPYYRG